MPSPWASNHFATAYVQALGVAPVPGWVNRTALLGSWVACLLPKRLLTDSAVGGDPSAAAHAPMRSAPTRAFSGTGQQSGSADGSRARGAADESRSAMRERAVQAALARERMQAGQSVE